MSKQSKTKIPENVSAVVNAVTGEREVIGRETGWYRVKIYESSDWSFAYFDGISWSGVCTYLGRPSSDDLFTCRVDCDFFRIDETPVNPVPANKTVIEYAIQEYGKDGATIHTTCDHLDSYDEAMEFKSGSFFPDDAWVVQFKTETRVVEGGE